MYIGICRKYRRGRSRRPRLRPLCIMAYSSALCGLSRLLRGFLRVQHCPALVLSALRAGAMGKLLLMAVRALRNTGLSQEVVGTAIGAAARRMAPFRIRHDAIPFAFSLHPDHTRSSLPLSRAERLKIIVLWTLSCCATPKAPPIEDPSDPPRRSNPGCCGSGRSAGKVLCSHPCTAS